MKLTIAQKRELKILLEYGICTICEKRRNKIYKSLVKKGYATEATGSGSGCVFYPIS